MNALTPSEKQSLHGSYNAPKDTINHLRQLDVDALVELWEIDMRNAGGERVYLCNQTNELGKPITFAGIEYLPFPIQGEGFKNSSDGTLERPNLKVGNLSGLITAANRHDYLLGATVYRRLVLAKYLDAVNFASGENQEANSLQVITQRFVIEQLKQLSNAAASFVLALPIDLPSALVPHRIVLSDLCIWQYKGDGCFYRGTKCFTADDAPTDDKKQDVCGKRLRSCKLRFGDSDDGLPFGGFPSSDRIGT